MGLILSCSKIRWQSDRATTHVDDVKPTRTSSVGHQVMGIYTVVRDWKKQFVLGTATLTKAVSGGTLSLCHHFQLLEALCDCNHFSVTKKASQSNFVLALPFRCQACNLSKSDKTFLQYMKDRQTLSPRHNFQLFITQRALS